MMKKIAHNFFRIKRMKTRINLQLAFKKNSQPKSAIPVAILADYLFQEFNIV